MCRFLVFHGRHPILMANLLTAPSHSIIKQSFGSREREVSSLNGDGFGVGWYTHATTATPCAQRAAAISPVQAASWGLSSAEATAPAQQVDPCTRAAQEASSSPVPCVFTSVSPAWNNTNLHRIAAKVASPLLFAHVRAATHNSMVNEANCHPFVHQRFMWMHNGMVEGFQRIKRRVVNALSDYTFALMQGTTDSEYCFMLFLTVFNEMWEHQRQAKDGAQTEEVWDAEEALEVMRAALELCIEMLNKWLEEVGVHEYSLLNFAVTDGHSVLVTRYVTVPGARPATLYFSSGSGFERDAAASARSSGTLLHPDQGDDADVPFHMTQRDRRQHCHIISSEPLTADPHDWVEVPTNHMVVITPQCNLLLYPLRWPDRYEKAGAGTASGVTENETQTEEKRSESKGAGSAAVLSR